MIRTKSLREFQLTRTAQYNCVVNQILPILENGKHAVVIAPVKSGKREIVEITSLVVNNKIIKNASHKPRNDNVQYYVTGLDRKDCKDQIAELETYDIIPLIGKEIRKNLASIVHNIETIINNGHTIYLHVDESDYGTAERQILADFIHRIYNLPNIHFIFYSATNEELLFSDFKKEVEIASFIPSENYCGYNFFLDNNLIQDAQSFFECEINGKEKKYYLSNQAKEICTEHALSQKQMGVIRLTTKENKTTLYKTFKEDYEKYGPLRKEIENIYQLQNQKVYCCFCDASTPFDWGNTWRGANSVHMMLPEDTKLLVFINQTSTRSTQWQIHDKLYFYHSYRSDKTPTNTILQADARCVHYNTSGNFENSKIKIFGDLDVFRFYAGRLNAENLNRPISQRIDQTSKKDYEYKVRILVEGDEGLEILHREGKMPLIKIERDGEIVTLKPQSIKTNGHRVRNASSDSSNLAKYIHSEKQGMASYDNYTYIDAPQTKAELGQDGKTWIEDWTEDWNIMLDKFPRIKIALDENKFVGAVFVREKIEKPIVTLNKSLYQNL